jgi:acyl phosphate:glycerol-3-phosphate acyltransferase
MITSTTTIAADCHILLASGDSDFLSSPSFPTIAAWMVAAYLLGSIPFGLLIGKARGIDIRQHGSKNIGATNCGRVCGWPCGIAAFLLDTAKGFFPTLAAVLWLPTMVDFSDEHARWLATVLIAAQPLVGHLFPVWLRFKGGKAVATSLGVLLALPMLRWIALAAFGVWVVVTAATRYVSVGSTVAALAFMGMYLWIDRDVAWTDYLAPTIFVFHIVGLLILRHRSNYARLLKGTESKLWGKKKSGGKPTGANS